MRGILPLVACALAALAASPGVGAETKTVQITRQGFTPSSITIAVNDSVTWHNADSVGHQVVANDGSFASPVLRPGETYTYTFPKAAKLVYHDSFASSKRGTVTVKAPPASVTLAAATVTVTYGETAALSGVVSNQLANLPVTLTAQPYGKGAQSVATGTTQAGGSFGFGVAPTIETSYQAHYSTAASPSVVVRVRPRVGFGHRGSRYVAEVTSDLSYAGRYVWLQRRSPFGGFRNVKRIYLGTTSRAVFTARLVRGRSILRLVLPDAQAGVGYVGSTSRTIAVARR